MLAEILAEEEARKLESGEIESKSSSDGKTTGGEKKKKKKKKKSSSKTEL